MCQSLHGLELKKVSNRATIDWKMGAISADAACTKEGTIYGG